MNGRFKNFKTKKPEVTPEEIDQYLNPANLGIDHSRPDWEQPSLDTEKPIDRGENDKITTIIRNNERTLKNYEHTQNQGEMI